MLRVMSENKYSFNYQAQFPWFQSVAQQEGIIFGELYKLGFSLNMSRLCM